MVVSQLGSLSGFTWKCGLSAKFSLGSPSAPTWSARIDDACLAGLYANMSIWNDHQRPFPPRNDHPDIQIIQCRNGSSYRHLVGTRTASYASAYDRNASWQGWLDTILMAHGFHYRCVVFFPARGWWTWISICCHGSFRDDYSSTTPILPDPCRSSQFVGKTTHSLQLDHLGSRTSRGAPWNLKIGLINGLFAPPQKDISGENPQVWACTSETNELQFFFSEKYLNAKNTQQISSVVGSCFIPFIDSLQNCINKYWF